MIKILVLSDTHGDNTWIEKKCDFDYVIHCGDHLNTREYMIRNTDYFVDGNNDFGNMYVQNFVIASFKFALVHGDEQQVHDYQTDAWKDKLLNDERINQADIILFGHTHIPVISSYKGKILLNPGSYSKPRMDYQKSYCEISIDDIHFSAKIINV